MGFILQTDKNTNTTERERGRERGERERERERGGESEREREGENTTVSERISSFIHFSRFLANLSSFSAPNEARKPGGTFPTCK